MDDRVSNVVVVGGGSAGWLSAVYLNRALSDGRHPECTVTLIESSDIGTVGVGESTLPTMRETLEYCGIDEDDFLLHCDASFKMAVKFVNWTGRPGYGTFYHPFESFPLVRRFPLSQYWLRQHLLGDPRPLDQRCFSTVPSCETRRAPKVAGDPQYRGRCRYAYHLDAGLFADYLKQLGKSRGVRHLVDTVADVRLGPDGAITHLVTQHHGDVAGDLFIDCSGFRGLLINEALREPFESYADALFCDSAIAIPVPYENEPTAINPYTTSTALSAGWAWHVPLFSRSGNGYVYASACISPDEAERELRRHLGPTARSAEARHLRMRVGRTRNAWAKNCVSIGLSSGFIEPLEATAIFLIEYGLSSLIRFFPRKHVEPSLRSLYNSAMRRIYENIRDFIILHYHATNREDTPFWRQNKYNSMLPSSLEDRLEACRDVLPFHDGLILMPAFTDVSYTAILAGMGYVPGRSHAVLDFSDAAEADGVFGSIQEKSQRLTETLPDHAAYLEQLRREEVRLFAGYLPLRIPRGNGRRIAESHGA